MLGLYAIVRSGGKQLRVEPGQVVKVERLAVEAGAAVDLDEVLLVGGEGEPHIGRPTIPGAKVRGTVIGHGKDRKILVFRYKAKKNVRKRRGHRQPFSSVRIDSIEVS